jgi:hypothetical protein
VLVAVVLTMVVVVVVVGLLCGGSRGACGSSMSWSGIVVEDRGACSGTM